MCFSATSSFALAAALAGSGVIALHQHTPRRDRLVAWIPILFAVQQVAEGVVWLTIHTPERTPRLHQLAVFTFLAFALIVWPTWMPLSLWRAEPRPRRRKVLAALLGVGVCVSLYAGWQLARGQPGARVESHSISYDYADVGNLLVLGLYLPVYVIATVLPFFVSSMHRARAMGAVLAMALVATFVIRQETLTSVWCFFATLTSVVIVISLHGEHRLALARQA